MISSWEVTDQLYRRSIERAVANALAAAKALHEEPDKIIEGVTNVTQPLHEPKQKARILSDTARLLAESGHANNALHFLLLALESARLAGRDTVMEVLTNGAGTLAAVDDGELLIRICHEIETIDGWFGAADSLRG